MHNIDDKERQKSSTDARLELSDGTVFHGESFGASTSRAGEVVFTTGMVGYPQTLTDPSYKEQIIVFTFPLIGNYGVTSNGKDALESAFESSKIHAAGCIVADVSREYSHWDAKSSLAGWLKENNIPAITGIDTRALTKRLREKGVMLGRIVVGDGSAPDFYDPNEKDLVAQVTTEDVKTYDTKNPRARMLLVDCGSKENIVRSLVKRDCMVIRVPYDHDFIGKLEHGKDYDGIVLSNGPGDPKTCKTTISNIKKAMEKGIPILGICLGNQLLALAAGADTYKLKYGHRSQNQPCVECDKTGRPTNRCYITSQNHGYAVDTKSLKKGWHEWFVNANDGTNEGIRHDSMPFMSVQFHPEACPGPLDTGYLFDGFIAIIQGKKP